MPWRFLAATATMVAIFGSSSTLRAQDDASSAKEKGAAQSAGAAEKSSSQDGASPGDAASGEKPAAAKSKASTSKTKSKKSNPRQQTSSQSANTSTAEPKYELATFGAGCFWHVEADFERLRGVVSAVSGYAGGNVRNPNYEMVHEGYTGHAEVVMVQYDPKIISYEDLLKVFWTCHDPTTLNRQGPDVGTQYRSIILYHNEEQRKAALKSYQQLVDARAFPRPIVTQLFPLKAFYRAEDEHQDYYGGKPRTTTRRRTTSTAKSKRPQSKVARALSAKPAADAEETKPSGDSEKETKPAAQPVDEKTPKSQP
jgi:peptide-methionine (S)-S-oxide reductase